MPYDISAIAPWLVPDKNWMENAVNAGTNLGSSIAHSMIQSRQVDNQKAAHEDEMALEEAKLVTQQNQHADEMDFKYDTLNEGKRQFDFNMPIKIAANDARITYQNSQSASKLLGIKQAEMKAQDAPLLESAYMGMNEAGKVGGRQAILNFKPPTFNYPDSYMRFTDTQIKVADAFGKTEEAKRYAQLNNVERARIQDIQGSDALSNEQKAIALDAVYAGANERVKKPTGTTSATPGSVIYDKATGKVLKQVPVLETETTVEKFAEVPATKAKTHLFSENEPAKPGQPERTVTTKKSASKATEAPEKEKRAEGEVYSTPMGEMKWTGTGWIKP